MPHVVTDRCDQCRYTECVAVCPVECFHADEHRLYINPIVCIDCGACVPVCPVKAVADVFDLPDDARSSIALNAEFSKVLPLIKQKQSPLETAETRRLALGF